MEKMQSDLEDLIEELTKAEQPQCNIDDPQEDCEACGS